VHLRGAARSDEHLLDGRVAEREVQRRGEELDAGLLARGGDPPRAAQDRVGSRLVLERRARPRVGQDPAVQDAGGDDGDATLGAEVEQLDGRSLVLEQCVAARDEDPVDLGLADVADGIPGIAHADADRLHDSLRAELMKRRVAVRRRLVPVLVRIVEIHDVHRVDAQPFQALVEGSEHSVAREVPPSVDGRVLDERRRRFRRARSMRHEEAADFGGDLETFARHPGKRGSEAALRHAGAVMRSGVEATYTDLECSRDRRVGLRLIQHLVLVAEWTGTERERGSRVPGSV
jgi:hypothetical protein